MLRAVALLTLLVVPVAQAADAPVKKAPPAKLSVPAAKPAAAKSVKVELEQYERFLVTFLKDLQARCEAHKSIDGVNEKVLAKLKLREADIARTAELVEDVLQFREREKKLERDRQELARKGKRDFGGRPDVVDPSRLELEKRAQQLQLERAKLEADFGADRLRAILAKEKRFRQLMLQAFEIGHECEHEDH